MGRRLRFVVLLLLGLCLAPGLHSVSKAAGSKLKARIAGLPKKPPKDGRTVARLVSFADATVLASKRAGNRPKKLSMGAPAVPSLLEVTYLSSRKQLVLDGVSHAIAPPSSGNVKTKLKLRELASPEPAALASAFAPLGLSIEPQAVGGRTLIGAPRSGFTVSGPGLDASMGAAEGDMTVGDVVGKSPCYDQEGGVVIVEVDPKFMEARNREFQLCADGYTDPATCPQDQYVPPDHSINGSMVSDGSQLEITLNYVDPDGNVISSESASGPIDDWFKIHDEVAKKLVKDLCVEPELTLTGVPCESSSCNCCEDASPYCKGKTYLTRIEGEATGPVGTLLDVNLPSDQGVIACGGWSEGSCAPVLCCERTALEQPEHIVFSAQVPFPPSGDCICPTPEPIGLPLLAQLVTPGGAFSDEQQALAICE